MAIFYLNDLDHFIKEKLGIEEGETSKDGKFNKEKLHIKYYIRYMDDFILIHENLDYLKWCLGEISVFLEKEKLVLNKKTNIYSMSDGITFLGFKYIFKNNRLITLISSKTKRRIKKRIRKNLTNILNYNGYLIFADSKNFKSKFL